MLEKPDIPDELILSRLQEEYGLRVSELQFLPIGADLRTAVYRVAAEGGTAYFLKLRRNFKEVIVLVPLLLKDKDAQEILVPFETQSGRHWSDFDQYKLILYPFIEGKDGFEQELTDQHRQTLGAAFKRIHTVQLPSALRDLIRKESFSPEWRQDMSSFLELAGSKTFDDSTAAKLAGFINANQDEIRRIIQRSEELAYQVRSQPLDLVLCHSDIHGGNILISNRGELYIVDWDDPLLAPKERDLMFIGGGIDEIWKTEREQSLFYEGYGKTDMNVAALAYYRYERVIEDLVVICEQILSTDDGGADRERSYGWFTSNFEPGGTIGIADQTFALIS